VEVLTMKELLETGVHFGHRTRKWNPKMARYIFTERKGIHIIDLEQTVDLFKKAYYYVRDRVGEGAEILFVGTKKQVQATIAEEAQRCGAHYVNRRWLGGTLTNFGTVKQSIAQMKKLEGMIEDGTVDHMPNKEASKLRRRLSKLQRNLDGLRHMESKPNILFVIDPDVELNAVREANILGIPVIAIVDTNCDPDPIDFLIPGNDDAIKATKLIAARVADAVLEGREGRQDAVEEPTAEAAPTGEGEPTADAEPEAADADAEPVAADEAVAETPVVEEVAPAEEAEAQAAEAEAEPEAVAESIETAAASEDEAPEGADTDAEAPEDVDADAEAPEEAGVEADDTEEAADEEPEADDADETKED